MDASKVSLRFFLFADVRDMSLPGSPAFQVVHDVYVYMVGMYRYIA